ncbi:hypothetical protein V1478_018096 [Vespula squamosa]|uniref:Uncharacterized protein n=1 Tax=Vespula squamosa TaxID=30214 RepID=A0ABD1ZW31_VESSQ
MRTTTCELWIHKKIFFTKPLNFLLKIAIDFKNVKSRKTFCNFHRSFYDTKIMEKKEKDK